MHSSRRISAGRAAAGKSFDSLRTLGMTYVLLFGQPHTTPDESAVQSHVNDSPIALEGMLPVLRDELPGANVVGLSRPAEALDYFETYPVALTCTLVAAEFLAQLTGEISSAPGAETRLGPWIVLFLALSFATTVVCLVALFRRWKKLSGVQRVMFLIMFK